VAVGLQQDQIGCALDHLDGGVEVGFVVPPFELVGLALVVEPVLAAGKTVQVDNYVHAFGDGVLDDVREGEELAAGVLVHGFLTEHESPVADWDANQIDAVGHKLVDVFFSDAAPVMLFQEETTFDVAENLTE
jgi:hypothetical protein